MESSHFDLSASLSGNEFKTSFSGPSQDYFYTLMFLGLIVAVLTVCYVISIASRRKCQCLSYKGQKKLSDGDIFYACVQVSMRENLRIRIENTTFEQQAGILSWLSVLGYYICCWNYCKWTLEEFCLVFVIFAIPFFAIAYVRGHEVIKVQQHLAEIISAEEQRMFIAEMRSALSLYAVNEQDTLGAVLCGKDKHRYEVLAKEILMWCYDDVRKFSCEYLRCHVDCSKGSITIRTENDNVTAMRFRSEAFTLKICEKYCREFDGTFSTITDSGIEIV